MSASSATEQVLIDGRWQASSGTDFFQSHNPNSGEKLPAKFPVSPWEEIERVIAAAERAFWELQKLPATAIAAFFDDFANRIDANKEALVAIAHAETGLPVAPRLGDVELPRTTNQLRLAAQAARSGSWALPTIDTKLQIRSCFQAIGPVCVFGPNNFPFAFGSLSGGDFAAALAAGNPVIGKANSSHPATTQLFGKLALESLQATSLPLATVQLIYRTSHEHGMKLVSDHRIGATGYTGSRSAGLQLKQAADQAGKPIYLELSSVNPVVFLPGALQERAGKLIDEYVGSVLMGSGQFCTNPGMILLLDNAESRAFVAEVKARFEKSAPGTLLSPAVLKSLGSSVEFLRKSGAEVLVGGSGVPGPRCAFANTLMQITASQFLTSPNEFQTEAFGNAALVVLAQSIDQMEKVLKSLEGNLTGCIYSAQQSDSDEAAYQQLSPILAYRVGRLLNDKMPTGVAVSSAMNHGGPFPSTGHPGFTAVGIPAAIHRFAKLTSFDGVRPSRLPWLLRDKNATAETWRLVDGQWSTADIGN